MTTIESNTEIDTIIKRFTNYDTETLIDRISVLAANIESAFHQCGLKPGVDYNAMDVMNNALALAIEWERKSKGSEIITSFAVDNNRQSRKLIESQSKGTERGR